MGRKNFNAFLKKQKAEKKRKKKAEKRQKLEERKQEQTQSNLEDMIAYVDEDGNIISDPPEEAEDDGDEK
jgi:uncharacterized protein YaaR (DUF327 family)